MQQSVQSLWTASLNLIHCTNTVLHNKHSNMGGGGGGFTCREAEWTDSPFTRWTLQWTRMQSARSLSTLSFSCSICWCNRWCRQKSKCFHRLFIPSSCVTSHLLLLFLIVCHFTEEASSHHIFSYGLFSKLFHGNCAALDSRTLLETLNNNQF